MIECLNYLKYKIDIQSNNDSSKFILLFSTLGVSSTVHHFRLKKEKLNQVIYLLNLKTELEDLESNH